MAFSIISWMLGNTTLAAVAGTGACTLAADAIRRYLGGSMDSSRQLRQVETADDVRQVNR
ncbi:MULTISPECIES: hypothetical protein [unclassified Micromonospora]|uniref:hypothetical protein n=1 Tax=unclassified Micromonospora TaxID=2617518 RepID=UPI00362EE215